MAKELTWRAAIDKVLGAATTPLHYKDIADKIIADGLRTSLGATPAATVNAQISSSIKRDGASSPYVRVAKGTFALAKSAAASRRGLTQVLDARFGVAYAHRKSTAARLFLATHSHHYFSFIP